MKNALHTAKTPTVRFEILRSATPRRPGPPVERPAAGSGDLMGEGMARYLATVPSSACDRLVELCRQALPTETGGLLAGHLGEDAAGPFASVEHVVEVEVERAGAAHVSWTGQAINEARAEIEKRPGNPKVIGWWHTHGVIDAFFSSTDREEQATYSDPRSLGLVVGRSGETIAGFHGPQSHPLALRLVARLDAEPLAASVVPERPAVTPVVALLETEETWTNTIHSEARAALLAFDAAATRVTNALKAFDKEDRERLLGPPWKLKVEPILGLRMQLRATNRVRTYLTTILKRLDDARPFDGQGVS